MAAYKRLDLNKRIRIQSLLESRNSLCSIAKDLAVSVSTVSREIHKYRIEHDVYGRCGKNRCSNFSSCTKNNLCPGMAILCRNKRCASCRKQNCNQACKDYQEYHCPYLEKPPYVCNGCPKIRSCTYRKKLYLADKADSMSAAIRSECRQGMNLTEDELHEIDQLLSERLLLGQSLHHIFCSSPDVITICEKTAYTLLHSGLISARPIDTPRMVRMSPRKAKKNIKVDKKCRINRKHTDFLHYLEENPDTDVLEGDTVEGRKGGKCILTLTLKSIDFQIGFLRDHNNSASVTAIVDFLYASLGDELFHLVFPDVWLLDNGSEFSNPTEIEKYGIRVFYCDPSKPYQKGTCENTHSFIRRVLPKGTSFDDLDQDFLDLMFSHINALKRKKLKDHSPFDLFSSLLAGHMDEISKAIHIQYIHPTLVELKPSLVRSYFDAQTSPQEASV